MRTYTINDYLNGDYETQNHISRYTNLKMLILDILSLVVSCCGLIAIEVECSNYYDQIAFQEYGFALEPDTSESGDSDDSTVIINGTVYDNVTKVTALIFKNENEDLQNNMLRIFVLTTTMFLVIILAMRASTYFLHMQIEKKIETDANYFRTAIFKTLVLEIMFHCILAYPKANSNFKFIFQHDVLYYNWDQAASLIQMGRVYLIYRMWAQYSIWSTEKSTLICNLCNSSGGIYFALKSELKYRPIIATGINLSLLIFLLGVAVRTSEISYSYISDLNWDYIWNGMWMIIIIATTVGYGDFYAKTYIGRIYVFLTCLLGPFLISLVNVIISNLSCFTNEESRAYENIRKKENTVEIAHRASNCIKTSMRYWGHLNLKFLSGITKQKSSVNYDFSKFKDSIMSFRSLRTSMNARYYEKPFDELLPVMSNDLKGSIQNLHQEYVHAFQRNEGALTRIMENQRLIKEKLLNNFDKLMTVSIKLNKTETKKLSLKNSPKFSLKIVPPNPLKSPTTTKLITSLIRLKESLQFNPSGSLFTRPNMTILNMSSLARIPSKTTIIMTPKKDRKCESFYLDFDDLVKQLKKKKKKRDNKEIDNSPLSSATRKKKNVSMKSVIIDESAKIRRKSRVQTIKMDNTSLQPIKENEENLNSISSPNRNEISHFNEDSTERNEEGLLLVDSDKFSRAKNKVSTFSPEYPKLTEKKKKFKTQKVTSSITNKAENQVSLCKRSLSLDIEAEELKQNHQRTFDNFLVEVKDFSKEDNDNDTGSV